MLQPKKTKKIVCQKGRKKGISSNIQKLRFGDFGLVSLDACVISLKTFESIRRILTRATLRKALIFLCVACDTSVSKKALGIRMGKGKGSHSYWAAKISAGQILVEIKGTNSSLALEALKRATYKLPCNSRIIMRW